MHNPFPITNYRGPKYFCDRNTELSILLDAFNNQRPIVVHAIRRIGKTGLIHHFHHHLKKKKVITIYLDVLDTQDDASFVNKLIQACIAAVETKKEGILTRLTKYFSRLRPTITFDPYSGMPEIELSLDSPKDIGHSLTALAQMLGNIGKPIQIAIDEFQQITQYPSTVIDASIRSQFQKMTNVHFLFSGSQRQLLLGLFSDNKKALFSSSQLMGLSYIDPQLYQAFIQKTFHKVGLIIREEASEEIVNWTYNHTFYTQYVCNRLFDHSFKSIRLKEIEMIKKAIFREYEITFLNYKRLLSSNQWKVVRGIARSESISSLNGAFLRANELAESSGRQALKALLDKEIIYEVLSAEGSVYRVYDPFFSRWLAR